MKEIYRLQGKIQRSDQLLDIEGILLKKTKTPHDQWRQP